MREQQACKIGMHPLVPADKFVGKRETRHKSSLLQPEYRSKAAREEYPFNGCERNQAFGKARLVILDPLQSPLSFPLDTRYGLNSIKEIPPIIRVLDIRVNEQRIGFRMDVFYHYLESVETPCFSCLDFVGEAFDEVFVDYSVRGSEECEDV